MNYSNKLAFLTLFIYSVPFFLYAQGSGGSTAPSSGGITFITALPFIDGDSISSLGDLVNSLFLLALVTGALLAVVKLVIAGATYMLSDVVTKKQSAIASIKGAVLGLLLILSTWLILTQINPNITNSTGINLPVITVPNAEKPLSSVEKICDSEEGCSRVVCPFFRTTTRCSTWCKDQGGVFHDMGDFSDTANECTLPGNDLGVTNATSDALIEEYGPDGTDELGEISEDTFIVSCHVGFNPLTGHQYNCSRDSFQEQCSIRNLEPIREVILDNEQDTQVLVCDSP